MKKFKFVFYFFLFFVLSLIHLNSYASNLTIYVNKGIGQATLGMNEAKAIKLLNIKPVKTFIDREYEGQTVYCSYFGKKDKDNNYELEIYSDIKKNIIIFVINSNKYATVEGIKVGTSESELLKIYGEKLKKTKKGGIYTKYSLGDKKGTDFYVKQGIITQIIVRDYEL